VQSLTILEDAMTADRVLLLDKTGQGLPSLISDMKLAVIKDGPHAIP
jgi:hypothetical protein